MNSHAEQWSTALAFCAVREHIGAARYRASARSSAALLGRFLPRLGPSACRRPFFLGPLLKVGLFGRGAIRPQLLERDGGKALRQGVEVCRQTIEARGALEAALVHVERTVELELDGVQPPRGIAVMLGDEAAGIGLVAADRVALLAQRRLDHLRHRRDAARA